MEVFVKGVSVLIDDEDYELFSKYKWHISCGYLRTNIKIDNKNKGFLLHRLILRLTDPKIITDHINHNKLDNRKSNLRVCTIKENSYNKSSHKNSTSKYIGVYLRKDRDKKKWVSSCRNIDRKSFYTEEEAALYYNELAIKRFGEFANLNIIE